MKSKISIITAVHNQLAMNKIFCEKLEKCTSTPYELIVIDNVSTDGSRAYLEEQADVLIANDGNYSYPYCQNQGIKAASTDYLAFLNNDLLVSQDWATKAIQIMEDQDVDVLSVATNDSLGDIKTQKRINRKWKRAKYPLLALFGVNNFSLNLSVALTYFGFDQYCAKRWSKYKNETLEAYSGSCFIIKRSALDKIGLWDERIQAADNDLTNRVKERAIEQGDIKATQLALGIYMHHYQRLTTKTKPIPFVDAANIITINEKWGDKNTLLRKDLVG